MLHPDFGSRIKIWQPGLKRRIARFGGRFNSSKAKTFLILAYSETAQEQEGWLSARQLAWLTGVSYGSLLVLLRRNWLRYGYLISAKARPVNSSRIVYCYRLSAKGHGYLKRNEARMPLDRYESEMESDRRARGYIE